MTIRAEVEGLGVLEFPDGTSGAVIEMAVQRELSARRGPARQATNPAAADPEVQTPFGTIKGEIGESAMFNPAAALIGAGDWLSKINRGFRELQYGPAEKLTGRKNVILEADRQQRAFAEQPMKELEDVNPGSVAIGKTAAMLPIPPAVLPVLGAIEEGTMGEKALRSGAALAGNQLAKYAGNYLAKAPERNAAAQATNKVRDELIEQARKEGLVFPPSATGGGGFARTMEGGLAGKAKTEQLAMVKNGPVLDSLARKEMGMAADASLTPEALGAIRSTAYQTGYKPIIDIPEVALDKPFVQGLAKLAPNSSGGAVKNPAAAEINDLISSLAGQDKWTGAQVVRDIQALREMARANYNNAARAGGDVAKTELARTQSEAADMLEKLAERQIMKNGGSMGAVKALHEARTTIAKAHDIEDALVNGSIDLHKIKDGGGSTGLLKMMADLNADKALRKSVGMPPAGAGNPVSMWDTFQVAGLGALGAGPASLALPAARVGARYGILSKPAQRAMPPDYSQAYVSQAMRKLLDNPAAPYAAGLYGYEVSR